MSADNEDQREANAANLAQMLRDAWARIRTPSFKDWQRYTAAERRIKYLAHIEAGFSEAHALELCQK